MPFLKFISQAIISSTDDYQFMPGQYVVDRNGIYILKDVSALDYKTVFIDERGNVLNYNLSRHVVCNGNMDTVPVHIIPFIELLETFVTKEEDLKTFWAWEDFQFHLKLLCK